MRLPGVRRKALARRVLRTGLGGGEGNSPKLQRFLIQLKEFNSVGAEAFHRTDLRDDARGHLNAPLILECHAGSDWQFAGELNSSAVPVQVRGLSVDGECCFVVVLSGEPHGRVQGHASAAPFSKTVANQVGTVSGRSCVVLVHWIDLNDSRAAKQG